MIKIIFDNSVQQYILVNLFKGDMDLIFTSEKEERVRKLYSNIKERINVEDEKWIDSIIQGTSEYIVDESKICKEELKKFN